MIKNIYNWIKEKINGFKKWIILGLVSGGILTASLMGLPNTVEVIQVQDIKVGEKSYHKFRDNDTGEIFKVEVSYEEVMALTTKNPTEATYPNATWIGSAGGVGIYEPPATLRDYEYYIIQDIASGTPNTRIKLPNMAEQLINRNLIVNDKINKKDL